MLQPFDAAGNLGALLLWCADDMKIGHPHIADVAYPL
jgi:hypothetical protein